MEHRARAVCERHARHEHAAFQAEELRWGFPNATHLVVENGGHETLPSEEVQSIVVDFFKGQDVSARRVRFDPPRFLSVEELKARGAGGRR